jgi:starch synthase
MTMRVAMLAAECEPWAKTGGLADVVDALARALGRLPQAGSALETPVDVFLPRYRSVPVPADAVTEPVLTIDDPDLARPGAVLSVSIVDVAADGYRLRLVDVPAAFDREAFYDHPDDAWRFALFCRAALAALRRDGRPLDVLHVHDWHTGPALLERARADAAGDPFLAGTAVVATLHNLAYHGWTDLGSIGQLGLRRGEPLAGANPDGIDLLLTAIERSEIANTVSPGFAREALTPAFGMGLDGPLRAKGNRFLGILNGIDPDVWDPSTDPALAAPFSRSAPAGKAACRSDLLERVGFAPDDDGVVLGMIGRLDPQKGFDLLADATPALLAAGARVIVQGNGNADLADPFRALAAAQPASVALIERFDRDMARRIYAGVDLFLMPSRFEPSGQGQMIAMRYGTPPVVRRTGGLADSVIDVTARPAEGNGFVFDEATPAALIAAVERAASLRATDKGAWAALLDRAMAADFRWDTGPAPRYLAAYERAIALRRGDG